MPFKETCPLEERVTFFRKYETGVFTVSALYRRRGISRETFDVWKRRRDSGETLWFEELSHAARAAHAPARDGRWALSVWWLKLGMHEPNRDVCQLAPLFESRDRQKMGTSPSS